jgi:hypothetical protein
VTQEEQSDTPPEVPTLPGAGRGPGLNLAPAGWQDDPMTAVQPGRAWHWQAVLRRTPGGALLLKGVVLVVGLAFILLGLALVALPGPLTIPPILLGLWIWSTEFRWADRLLDRAKASAQQASQEARRRPVLTGLVTGGGLAALGVGIYLATRYSLVDRLLAYAGLG